MIKKQFHRRNLPHLYYNEGIYFITFRLYASIHPNELEKLIELNKLLPDSEKRFFKKYDSLLDKPFDKIEYLRRTDIAEICKSSIHYFDGKEYKLICYCIMPNHIHLVFELLSKEKNVGDLIGSVKKYSARKINKILNETGSFWQAESFDRLVRDEKELYSIIKYVLLNPQQAGLVSDWKEWENTFCRPDFQVID